MPAGGKGVIGSDQVLPDLEHTPEQGLCGIRLP